MVAMTSAVMAVEVLPVAAISVVAIDMALELPKGVVANMMRVIAMALIAVRCQK